MKQPATIGAYIKHLRLIQEPESWSLKTLGEKCGLSVSYLSDIQRGRVTNIPLDSLEAIALAFGMRAGDLLVKVGYTINPVVPRECSATFEVTCKEGQWTIERL